MAVLTLEALFAQADNALLLRHFRVTRQAQFASPMQPSPFDEGGKLFFDRWGRDVPESARAHLDTLNLFAHERTARIFAFHHGRLTVLVREDGAPPCKGETLDGTVDLQPLGPGWAWLDSEDDPVQTLVRAHAHAGR